MTQPSPLKRQHTVAWGLGFVIAGLLITGVTVGLRAWGRETRAPVALASVGYVGSAACQGCHPGRYESWHRTYHRTMTQDAKAPGAVLGAFDGSSFIFQGVRSRFLSEGGRPTIETLGPDGALHRYPVERTVGSRRVQQYLTREGDRLVRLPLAWNVEERRWLHLNGGFLTPDGADFNSHRALWDANCIFCHNVKAQPGYDWERGTFQSQVAELGIACEACHGPGAEHAARNANPFRRYYLRATSGGDPTIVDPKGLPPAQQVQVCGHCHGQRLPAPTDRIREFLARGDPYTAGEDLSRYTAPLTRDSHLPGVDVALRFWRDGTPRLTAYEYQGLLMSEDHARAGMTCTDCHNAHGGDPKGMITDAMRGPQACVRCHPALSEPGKIAAHTRHREDGPGSDCYACHMPKITYGLLDVHPTHRVQRPDPARAWRHDMPEACTVCHTDRTARWAAESMARLFQLPVPRDLPHDGEWELAEDVRALLGGDVVQRAVAALALGEEKTALRDPVARLWSVPFLLVTLEDRYPAVRRFAYRSLRAVVDRAAKVRPELAPPALPFFGPESSPEERQRLVEGWRTWWAALDKRGLPRPDAAVPLDDAFQPRAEVIESLRKRQGDAIIAIGE